MNLLTPLSTAPIDLGWLAELSELQIQAVWDALDPSEQIVFGQAVVGLANHRNWVPYPHQIPPPPGWYLWLLLAGRGAGKTDACAHYMDEHAMGSPCLAGPTPHRMLIVAPTLGDASDACVHGPSGLKAHNPDVIEGTRKGGTFVTWPNGAEAKLLGAYTKADVERFRAGGNRCMVWCEELAAWRYLRDAWDHIRFGLREGPHPHVIASTTPRNRPTIKRLVTASTTAVTRARTGDNLHLPKSVRDALEETYGGTRLGLQELEGEILDDIEGALWTSELIEQQMRCAEPPTVFERIVIAVDPSWGRGTGGDEVGIIAAGKSRGVAYILADRSGRMRPNAWGRVAAELYDELEADRMIAEANFQAEQVKLVAMTLNTDPNYEGGRVTFHEVHASRGKRLRAEPVVGLCEQGRVKIVGQMPLLEHQLTHWVPPEIGDDGDDKGDPEDSEPAAMEVNSTDTPTPSDFSPDRLDAMVFAVTDLLLGVSGKARLSRPSGTIPGVRTGGGQLGRRPGARVVSHD